jgi:AraC family transcriptional regulator of arabinose operon
MSNATPHPDQQLFGSYESEDVLSNRILHTPGEFARKNLLYLQEAGSLQSIQQHSNTREKLDSYLFVIVLSGRGEFRYRGQTYPMQTNDCIFLDCHHHYTHRSSAEEPWHLMWVHMNGGCAAAYSAFYEELSSSMVFHTSCPGDYTNIINNCIQLHKSGHVKTDFLLAKLLTDLLTLCVTNRISGQPNETSEQLEQIREYIDRHLQQKLSLTTIADQFFVNKFYLARAFRLSFGMTVGEYISSARITYAKELLRFTNKSIDEISDMCGIPDTNYFAKVFRKLEGCSASEYRKKW